MTQRGQAGQLESVLKPTTYALAEGAYLARRADEIQALKVELQRAQADIAARIGATGAPGFVYANKLGGEHVRQQCTTAAEELMRACTSTGELPTRVDLETCWTRLMEQTRTEPEQALKGFLLPHLAGGGTMTVAGMLDGAATQGRAIVNANFAHFVAERNRDEREKRWRVIAWFGAAFAGAFLAKSPDLVQWLLHLGATAPVK
jgi:hypothetical protein